MHVAPLVVTPFERACLFSHLALQEVSCCPEMGEHNPPRYSPKMQMFQKDAEWKKIGSLGSWGGSKGEGVFLENLKNHRKPCRNYSFGIPRAWTLRPLINTILRGSGYLATGYK